MSVSIVSNYGQKSSFVITTSHLTKKATNMKLLIWNWYIQVYVSKFGLHIHTQSQTKVLFAMHVILWEINSYQHEKISSKILGCTNHPVLVKIIIHGNRDKPHSKLYFMKLHINAPRQFYKIQYMLLKYGSVCIKPMRELSKQYKKFIKQLLTMLNKSQEIK